MFTYRYGKKLFSWKNSSWRLIREGDLSEIHLPSIDVHAIYNHGDDKQQVFQLVKSLNKPGSCLDLHYVGVDVSGLCLWWKHRWPHHTYDHIGSGAPIGAFLRELTFCKVPGLVCTCHPSDLLACGCSCGHLSHEKVGSAE